MFELNRLHSQTLARFAPRKLAMSLLGGAGEIRTHVLDGVTLDEIRALASHT
ncbi:MAG: hypothetical protein ACPGLY_26475 [Rubripirellula sp.]